MTPDPTHPLADPPGRAARGDASPAAAPRAPAARTALGLLRDVFGFREFRPHQGEIVEHVAAGGDAFVLMPTGGGKSLCYQLPALLRHGAGIVVSPLISLMKDQVDALRAAGVSAAAYNSSLEGAEARRVLAQLHRGELDLLYVAPETLMTASFLERLRGVGGGETSGVGAGAGNLAGGHHAAGPGESGAAGRGERAVDTAGRPSEPPAGRSPGIALFAIDEAHCVSQWGHDFRPEYVQLGELRGLFPGVPLLACTATADPQTRDDVRLRLGLADAPVFVTGFDRPNIRYTVVEKREPLHQLKAFLAAHDGESGIVYCLSRKRTEEVAGKLAVAGIPAAAYHAGLPADERRRVQDAFARDDVLVVVATVAFGMGIDKSDVRFVVHYDLPKTIESYYQETGRAGRDSLPAEALLLFGLGDAAVVRSLVEGGGRGGDRGRGGNGPGGAGSGSSGHGDGRSRDSGSGSSGRWGDPEYERDPEQVRVELHKLNAMVGLAEALSCRRRALLGYFGEELGHDCGNCDVCLDPPETYDATEHAQMALSCVYRTGQRFGIGHVVDVLRGSESEKVLRYGHDQVSTYGIGAEVERDHWVSLIRQLVHRGYLVQDIAQYSALRLTPKARDLLNGDERLVLAKPRTRVPTKKQRVAAARAARVAGLADLEVDEALFARLRALRKRLADEQRVPAYVIFSDATLAEMAARRPGNYVELLAVNGVGQAKLERYGDAFIEAIAAHEG